MASPRLTQGQDIASRNRICITLPGLQISAKSLTERWDASHEACVLPNSRCKRRLTAAACFVAFHRFCKLRNEAISAISMFDFLRVVDQHPNHLQPSRPQTESSRWRFFVFLPLSAFCEAQSVLPQRVDPNKPQTYFNQSIRGFRRHQQNTSQRTQHSTSKGPRTMC